jgi:hypothetical protein
MKHLFKIFIYLAVNLYTINCFPSQLRHNCVNKCSTKLNAQTKTLIQKKTQTQTQYIEEITWDDGEVAWENMTNDIEDKKSNYFKIPKKINSQKNTPLYDKIELDQIKIASIAAFIRTTYREIVNTDSVISEFSNILNKQIMLNPSEILLISMFTGFAIIYNKTNEAEEKRIERLYKLYNNQNYYEKYIKMRRISMALLIIITCLTTRNVQPVE